MAALVLRGPLRNEYLKEMPDPTTQLQDALVMALVLFLQIIYNFYNSDLRSWDHSSVSSRIAVAVSCGLALKFTMDEPPYATSVFMCMMMKPGELSATPAQIKDYVSAFECRVMDRVSIFRCSLNHKTWASDVVEDMKSRNEVSDAASGYVYEMMLFVTFNLCEFLPDYGEYDESTLADAMVALSGQCAKNAFVLSFPIFSKRLRAEACLLAAEMALVLSTKPSNETQGPLKGAFVDETHWKHRATTPAALRRAAADLRCVSLGDGEQQHALVLT